MPPIRKPPQFPNPGTDRRPDELERNLSGEADAEVSRARAVETDRVADEDREASDKRSSAIEKLINGNRRLIDVLALAVLVLLAAIVVLSVLLWKSIS
jgi:hypothetical protein